jgi:NAD(P)-dependent dehydrogenase (short-subunit alcohol dehydrogenase family)
MTDGHTFGAVSCKMVLPVCNKGMAAGFARSKMRRSADPREIAETTAFLASDRASFATGSIFVVDCGCSVRIARSEVDARSAENFAAWFSS